MPDTKPGISFDNDGVCGACRNVEQKKNINWDERNQELIKICDSIRGKNGNGYDCIVPVSGGKDSFFQAYIMSQELDMKVLCVCMQVHMQTYEGICNLNNLVEKLNVDLIKINVKPSIHKKLRRTAFFKIGNPNWSEHRIVFSGVARASLLYKVPLVVWGEDIAQEFGGNIDASQPKSSAENIDKNDLFREAEMVDLVGDEIPEDELFFYMYPNKELLKENGIQSIYLSYYKWWNGFENYQLSKSYGFIERREGNLSGNIINYDNIDEKLCEIHIWLKFLKLGFWRPTDQCCYSIWTGRMEREEAVDTVNRLNYEFPHEYLQDFLDYHEITEGGFWDNMEKWTNKDIFHKVNGSWRLKVEPH